MMNAIYEAKTRSCVYDKLQFHTEGNDVVDDTTSESCRTAFVQYKYRQLKYFDPHLYQTQLQRFEHKKKQDSEKCSSSSPETRSENSQSAHPVQEQPHIDYEYEVPVANSTPTENNATIAKPMPRRARSFDSTGPSPKDYLRKPTRRQSQSFHSTDMPTTDAESTDDEQRLSYNLPGFLGVPADATSKRKQNRRQKSLPSLSLALGKIDAGSNNNTAPNKPRRQRRRQSSLKCSLTTSSTASVSSTEDSIDLGYGDQPPPRPAQRRGRTDTTTDVHRRRRSRRRSLPSLSAMLADKTESSATVSATAPRMPQRIVSDESGSDTDDGFVTPPPHSNNTGSGTRQQRRRSLPLMSAVTAYGDTDEDTLSGDTEDKNSICSPKPMPAGRLGDSSIRLPYGMDLGYGFNHGIPSKIPGNHGLSATAKVAVKPKQIPRQSSTSDGYQEQSISSLSQSSKIPTVPSSTLVVPSLSDLGYGEEEEPTLLPGKDRKAQRKARRRKSASRVPGLRRCNSTGAAIDLKLCPAQHHGDTRRRQRSFEKDGPKGATLVQDAKLMSSSSTDANRRTRRTRRRSSAGGSSSLSQTLLCACVDGMGSSGNLVYMDDSDGSLSSGREGAFGHSKSYPRTVKPLSGKSRGNGKLNHMIASDSEEDAVAILSIISRHR